MKRALIITGLIFLSGIIMFLPLENASAEEQGPGLDIKGKISGQLKKTIQQIVEYIGADTRDPFEAYLKKEELKPKDEGELAKERTFPSLTVQGIIWGGRFPQAIINGKVVKVDDVIEGARVTDITKEGITVFFNNRQQTLASPAQGAPEKTTDAATAKN